MAAPFKGPEPGAWEASPLAAYAAGKQFPQEPLRELGLEDGYYQPTRDGKPVGRRQRALLIPYRDEDGNQVALRYRVSLNGKRPFRWDEGVEAKQLLYGLDRRKRAEGEGWAFLVEGESDCHTAWFADLPAFGVPGVGAFDPELAQHLLGGSYELYLVQEPGNAGEQLLAALASAPSSLRSRVRVVRLDGAKDLSELHLSLGGDREAFRAKAAEARAQAVPLEPEPRAPEGEPAAGAVRIVSLDTFADTEEEGEEAVLGDRDNAVIPEAGDVMVYGDGGAGKTTLVIDLACHLAAGDDWLGVRASEPRRVLLIENEGPRARFRRKLRRKRNAWAGSELGNRVEVLEAPWAAFTFASEEWRAVLADAVRERGIDVVIVGPVASAGMEKAGTLQEVREFLALVADVRKRSGRRLVVVLVHHEAKGGRVSGAWEGAGDTLVHVSKQAHGRMRLEWQKTRWASDYHSTALTLLWAEGDTFTVEEAPEALGDEVVDEKIVEAIRERPGTSWGPVEDATPGIERGRRNARRDDLLRRGRIVNVRRRRDESDSVEYQLGQGVKARLYVPDHPEVIELLRARGEVAEKTSPPTGGTAPDNFSARSVGERGGEVAEVPPAAHDSPAEADEWADRYRELGLYDDAGTAGGEEEP
jgi:KaiC/GvpD/RAD55 family RecA-like ATPase